MAISSVTNRVAYQGDGTSAVFAFGYELHGTNDLAVFAFNSSATTGGIIRALTKDAAGAFGYSFSGTVNSAGVYPTGGNITFNSTPNIQTAIIIFRSSAVTADFLVNKFQPVPGDGVTNAIDRLTMIAQRAQDLNTRSVRLPDGFFGTFDTTLPENILQSAGKRLIVNSGATGFTFDETLASYIPNTIAYANTNSSITSLGGGATDLFLKSQGSSAPVWGAIDIGSAAVSAGAITGVLPVSTGGTGQSSFVATALVYAASATQLASIPSALEGSILTAHGSSAPSFDTFSATNINSGLVRVTNGGTGTGTQFPPGQLILAGSAGIYTTGSASLTAHVSGILPVTNGGTGNTNIGNTQILFASSASQVSAIPGAANLRFLMSNGSSIPTYELVSGSSINSVGATVGHVLSADGSGGTLWQPAGALGDNEVWIGFGNGYGSTNAKIRTHRTILRNVGSSITYASSAVMGGSFIINDAGIYSLYTGDLRSGAAGQMAFTVNANSSEIGVDPAGILSGTSLLALTNTPSAGLFNSLTVTVRLKAGDIVRYQTDGVMNGSGVWAATRIIRLS